MSSHSPLSWRINILCKLFYKYGADVINKTWKWDLSPLLAFSLCFQSSLRLQLSPPPEKLCCHHQKALFDRAAQVGAAELLEFWGWGRGEGEGSPAESGPPLLSQHLHSSQSHTPFHLFPRGWHYGLVSGCSWIRRSNLDLVKFILLQVVEISSGAGFGLSAQRGLTFGDWFSGVCFE